MRLAVLGGSYNPIHIGHLMLADTACRCYGYDTIAFIPAFLSPFKDSHEGCTGADRLAMVNCAIADNSAFYCDPCEIQRQGRSYTIDTLRFLAEKYPHREGKIGLIIGDDLLAGLDSWREAARLSDYADIIVGNRIINRPMGWPQTSINSVSNTDGTSAGTVSMTGRTAGGIPYMRLENAFLPVSSTNIRAAVKEKKSWRYLVPAAVYSYIKEHKLYE